MMTWQKLIFDKDCCAMAFRLLLTKIKSSRRASSNGASRARIAGLTPRKQAQPEENDGEYEAVSDDGEQHSQAQHSSPASSRTPSKSVVMRTRRKVAEAASVAESGADWNFDTSLGDDSDRTEGPEKTTPVREPLPKIGRVSNNDPRSDAITSVTTTKIKKSQMQNSTDSSGLVEENNKLREEIVHLEGLVVALQNGNNQADPAAGFDERRMRLLQAQNLQLQRQIHLLQEAALVRQNAETNLLSALNHWRHVIETGRREAQAAGADESSISADKKKPIKWMLAVPDALLAELRSVEAQIQVAATSMNASFEAKLRTSEETASFVREGNGNALQQSLAHLRVDRVKKIEERIASVAKALDEFVCALMETHAPCLVELSPLNSFDRRPAQCIKDMSSSVRALLLEVGAFGIAVPTPWTKTTSKTSTDSISAIQIVKYLSAPAQGSLKDRERQVKSMLKQLHAHHVAQENERATCRREVQFWQKAWQTQADLVQQLIHRVRCVGDKKVQWCQAKMVEPIASILEVLDEFHKNDGSTSRHNPYLPLLLQTLDARIEPVLLEALTQWRQYQSDMNVKIDEIISDYGANMQVLMAAISQRNQHEETLLPSISQKLRG